MFSFVPHTTEMHTHKDAAAVGLFDPCLPDFFDEPFFFSPTDRPTGQSVDLSALHVSVQAGQPPAQVEDEAEGPLARRLEEACLPVRATAAPASHTKRSAALCSRF